MIEVKNLIENLYYKKIIVWCGLINICNELYKLWKEYFSDYTVCIDTSQSLDENNFEKFKNLTEKGILFCAAKHREGSDIQNLDACIFPQLLCTCAWTNKASHCGCRYGQ